MSYDSTEIHLVARPVGEPQPTDFATVHATVGSPGPGQVVVRNTWMSVDPYMRGRMNDRPSYIAPFVLDQAMRGGAVGEVVESASDRLPVGSVVLHDLGWRTHALLDESEAEAIDVSSVDATAYLGVLGLTGFTAYVGLKMIAPVGVGDTVLISGAAGGVGLAAGVIAKKLGAARVVGSAGGPDKTTRLVEEFGYDAAVDYKEGDLWKQVVAATPDGVDVYLDNVGGEHLQVAIGAMNDFGRIALCGAISQYNVTTAQPGPNNLVKAVAKRLSLRGYIVLDHDELRAEWISLASSWLADGSLTDTHTSVDGIDHALEAFTNLSRGANVGKMLVRL